MLDSDIPQRVPVPFGESATPGVTIRTVPLTTADPNAASYTLGFPPNTFTPLGAGGEPPDGRDVNGILNVLSAWAQWQAAGAPVGYDATFSASIGGYPKGSILAAAIFGNYWLSTADNNVTNPDAAGAGWVGFSIAPLYVADSGAVNALAASYTPAITTLADLIGRPFYVRAANANTLVNPTVTVNALAPMQIVNPDGSTLNIGQIPTSGVLQLMTADGVTAQLLSQSGRQPMPAPTYLASPGAWGATIPSGVTTAKVTIGGGGGGGGGNSTTQASGGGGQGAIGVFFLTGLVAGQLLSGAIGVGGVAGISGGGSGGIGGNTTLLNNGTLIATANGGVGGAFSIGPAGGIGGGITLATFTGTYIPLQGGYGSDGANSGDLYGGQGAPGWLGTGGGRAGTGGGGGGKAGSAPTAGGGGSYTATAGPGGAGAPGFVLIEWLSN